MKSLKKLLNNSVISKAIKFVFKTLVFAENSDLKKEICKDAIFKRGIAKVKNELV